MKWLSLTMLALVTATVTRADTMTELHGCLQECVATHDQHSWAFHLCVRDCRENWAAQKGAVNVTFDPASTGHASLYGLPALIIEPGALVTARFAIHSADDLERIDLYLHHDGPLPPPPEFGDLVGSDLDGDDGWDVTFDAGPHGDFVGLLVARAHFAGHDEEIDGDQAVIVIGTSLPIDAPDTALLDVAADALTLAAGDGVALGNLTLRLGVGADFSPSVPIDVTVAVAGHPALTETVAPEVFANPLSCVTMGSPCVHECPPTMSCETIRFEYQNEAYDVCVCEIVIEWPFAVPAEPGDLVLVRLDGGNAWPEVVESNNVASARVPSTTGVADPPAGRFIAAVANRPNPFNPRTLFVFDLAAAADVRIEISDLRGRRVRAIAAGRHPAGRSQLDWNGLDDTGRPLASGVYRYHLRAGGETATGTLTLVR